MNRLLLLIFTILFSTQCFATTFKQIIFFGDSLTDNGNMHKLFKILPKSPPYYEGRFTNGPTWAEGVANYYANKEHSISDNLAFGGATAIYHGIFRDGYQSPVTLDEEEDTYLLGTIFTEKSDNLYVIWIGGNDYLFEKYTDNNLATEHVVSKIGIKVRELMVDGAKHFLIINLPDLAETPFARKRDNADQLHQVAVLHNEKLAKLVDDLRAHHPDVKITTVDSYAILSGMISDPEKFNQQYGTHIVNTHDACWQGGLFLQDAANSVAMDLKSALANQTQRDLFSSDKMAQAIAGSPELLMTYQVGKAYDAHAVPCDHPDEYVFWDDVHPTAVAHEVFARIVIKALQDNGEG